LEERQMARLEERAAATGATRSELIRQAVDAYLESPDERDDHARLERFREAVDHVAGIAPMFPGLRAPY